MRILRPLLGRQRSGARRRSAAAGAAAGDLRGSVPNLPGGLRRPGAGLPSACGSAPDCAGSRSQPGGPCWLSPGAWPDLGEAAWPVVSGFAACAVGRSILRGLAGGARSSRPARSGRRPRRAGRRLGSARRRCPAVCAHAQGRRSARPRPRRRAIRCFLHQRVSFWGSPRMGQREGRCRAVPNIS